MGWRKAQTGHGGDERERGLAEREAGAAGNEVQILDLALRRATSATIIRWKQRIAYIVRAAPSAAPDPLRARCTAQVGVDSGKHHKNNRTHGAAWWILDVY